jgi:hypothetical protein
LLSKLDESTGGRIVWGQRKKKAKAYNPDEYDSDGNEIGKNDTLKRILHKNLGTYIMKK